MSTFVHSRFVLFVCSWGLIVLASACGSTKSSSATERPEKTGQPMRVRWVAYKTGTKMELVNESHSDRTEMYSTTKKLDEAFVKVTPDEVLDETIANIKKGGFDAHAAPGSAPPTSSTLYQAFEIEQKGRSSFWALSSASTEDDIRRFGECFKLFKYVYNETYQLQSVERAPDWESQNSSMKKPRKQ